eukprot:gnl/MRDRNA2_/MRDRNA2_29421_c0_seq1.p1 gnl/MRDRNA2_/MRDRNA2_29421_c0~~gnl/MRDRNA2_/MRDRNA2_29421_c0_seq1.p1  ORF type:complete len:667 (+),score=93.81 gnl/MRDRNA2_/MRDRNA2_29421_c0_seq1:1315-3315(+)
MSLVEPNACAASHQESHEVLIRVCLPFKDATDAIEVKVSGKMHLIDLKQKIQLPTRTPCAYQQLVLQSGEILEKKNDRDSIENLMQSCKVIGSATVMLVRLLPDGTCLESERDFQIRPPSRFGCIEKYPLPCNWRGGQAVMEMNVQYILEAAANINSQVRIWRNGTFLHFAAHYQLAQTCEMLLEDERFTQVDCQDAEGATALHIAAIAAKYSTPYSSDICITLLQADRVSEVNSQDKSGCTALHYAVQSGKLGLCKAFLQTERFTAYDAPDKNGQTVLHHAVIKGLDEICHVLLQAQPFVGNMKDYANATALHYAAKQGREGICRTLLAHVLFAEASAQDTDGYTALHYAAQAGLASICTLLLHKVEHGTLSLPKRPCLGHGCRKRRSKLRSYQHAAKEPQAAYNGTCELVGSLINMKNKNGATALHCAAGKGRARVCKLLLQHKHFTELNAKDKSGATALHHASRAGFYEACCALINSSGFTELNAKDSTNETALHCAARRGDVRICKMLLKDARFLKASAFHAENEPGFAENNAFSLAVRWVLYHRRSYECSKWRRGRLNTKKQQPLHVHRSLLSMLQRADDSKHSKHIKGGKLSTFSEGLPLNCQRTMLRISRTKEEGVNLWRGQYLKDKYRWSKKQRHCHGAFLDDYLALKSSLPPRQQVD